MKVAVFGNSVDAGFIDVLQDFFRYFEDKCIEVQLYQPFYSHLINIHGYYPYYTGFFDSYADFDPENKLIFSVGGDGTFLHSVQCIRNYKIPVVGVNSGRLGFLADTSQEQLIDVLNLLIDGQYNTIERSMLEVDIEGYNKPYFNYALNEMAVLKTDNSSMITVRAYANGEFLNNYWADGLIIATPTGSTAYSLSVGGPILTPDSENFVINPIAPHNLTIRPIVVPDTYELLLKVEGRGSHFLASLDSHSVNVGFPSSITIKKSSFKLKTVILEGHSFFGTLRNKLMWGLDKRN